MPNTYTQEQIDEAIEILECYASDTSGASCVVLIADFIDSNVDLANEAWFETSVSVENDWHLDALEAAARLREGKLPGTPEWGENDDTDEDDTE
jgi:hypothetical protein